MSQGSQKFAKLFERNGEQVLVQVNEEEPGISLKVSINGQLVTTTVKIEDDGSADTNDRAWEVADSMLEKITEEEAFEFRLEAINVLKDQLGEA